jgi:hypothetical protein
LHGPQKNPLPRGSTEIDPLFKWLESPPPHTYVPPKR